MSKLLLAFALILTLDEPMMEKLKPEIVENVKEEYARIPKDFLERIPTISYTDETIEKKNDPKLNRVIHPRRLVEEQKEPENFDLLISLARQRAQNILVKASGKLHEKQEQSSAKVYEETYLNLRSAQIAWPSGDQTFRGCKEKTLAYAYIGGPKRIYLCRLSYEFNEKGLAQILVHESAHLQGYKDECDATFIEVGAVRWAGEDLAFKNAYWDSCFNPN